MNTISAKEGAGDVLDRFLQMAEQAGGSVSYQTLINSALREYLDG
jgi:uncharacterized protein (DUF4415 family)